MRTSHEQFLVDFVENTLDERLRGVVRYDDDTIDWCHLRPDLEANRGQLALHRIARQHHADDRYDEGATEVYVPNDAAIYHFPHDPEAGMLLSLEPHTAVEPGFIRACRDILQGEYPERPVGSGGTDRGGRS